jgi:hypothetical protein
MRPLGLVTSVALRMSLCTVPTVHSQRTLESRKRAAVTVLTCGFVLEVASAQG